MAEIILKGSREIIRGDRLRAALRLIDTFTESEPIGEIRLFLNGISIEPVKNLSGYYLFFDLPGDEPVIRVISQYYFPGTQTVTPADLDPLSPLIEILLTPGVSYPFPPGVTLIRGSVVDGTGTPVINAQVRVQGKDVTTITDRRGEFVLFFTHLSPGDVLFDDSLGKRIIIGPPPPPEMLRVIAEKGLLSGFVPVYWVEEGTTVVLQTPIEMT